MPYRAQANVPFRPIAVIRTGAKLTGMTMERAKHDVLRIACVLIIGALICGVAYLWFTERKPPTGLSMLLMVATVAKVWIVRRFEPRNQPNT